MWNAYSKESLLNASITQSQLQKSKILDTNSHNQKLKINFLVSPTNTSRESESILDKSQKTIEMSKKLYRRAKNYSVN